MAGAGVGRLRLVGRIVRVKNDGGFYHIGTLGHSRVHIGFLGMGGISRKGRKERNGGGR